MTDKENHKEYTKHFCDCYESITKKAYNLVYTEETDEVDYVKFFNWVLISKMPMKELIFFVMHLYEYQMVANYIIKNDKNKNSDILKYGNKKDIVELIRNSLEIECDEDLFDFFALYPKYLNKDLAIVKIGDFWHYFRQEFIALKNEDLQLLLKLARKEHAMSDEEIEKHKKLIYGK